MPKPIKVTSKKVTPYMFHQSNLIEGFDSEEADHALYLAWRRLPRPGSLRGKLPRLSHHNIKAAQELVLSHQDVPDIWRGRYRSDIVSSRKQANNHSIGAVWVGGKLMPQAYRITNLMDYWLAKYGDYTKDFDPIQAHIEFEQIHPFMDGNGRTGRLLMWWHQKMKGQGCTIIRYDERFDYYDWFSDD